MGNFSHGLTKWFGYLAKGAMALVFFGITGWLALLFAGYAYLQLLCKENPLPRQTNLTEVTQVETNTNPLVDKLPPNRVTPPIRARRNRIHSRRVTHHDSD